MPAPLIAELKVLVEKNHYLDLSEELRSVIRQRARHYLDPYTSSVNDLKEKLTADLKTQNQQLRKEEVMRELKKLLEVNE